MSDDPACAAPRQLTLRSRLEDLGLVPPWVEALAACYALPPETCFAINLCMEEVLSNIVRHGYAGEPSQTMTVQFELSGDKEISFIVDDSAPHFDPTARPLDTVPLPLEEMAPGGQGIRLLRRFAGSVRWEPLPHGNRLRMTFPIPQANRE